jgi:hypothetical protein
MMVSHYLFAVVPDNGHSVRVRGFSNVCSQRGPRMCSPGHQLTLADGGRVPVQTDCSRSCFAAQRQLPPEPAVRCPTRRSTAAPSAAAFRQRSAKRGRTTPTCQGDRLFATLKRCSLHSLRRHQSYQSKLSDWESRATCRNALLPFVVLRSTATGDFHAPFLDSGSRYNMSEAGDFPMTLRWCRA